VRISDLLLRDDRGVMVIWECELSDAKRLAKRTKALMGRFYEFFAGGGMARLGLGDAWTRLHRTGSCRAVTLKDGAEVIPLRGLGRD
jgi:hypothetical protein